MKVILIQFLIGSICGFLLAFSFIATLINSKDKDMKFVTSELCNALKNRYSVLRKVLACMKKHMLQFEAQISDLDTVLAEAENSTFTLDKVYGAIIQENKINKALEDIKANMGNFPSLDEDEEFQNLIKEITEAEAVVGDAIGLYNAARLEYTSFLDLFPISIVSGLMGKKSESIIQFSVSNVQEFDDNYYIDEDEI